MLLELKGHSIEEKIKVLQSFDHKLSKDEKEALEDIIEEAVKAQQRREEIKMQRKEENE